MLCVYIAIGKKIPIDIDFGKKSVQFSRYKCLFLSLRNSLYAFLVTFKSRFLIYHIPPLLCIIFI